MLGGKILAWPLIMSLMCGCRVTARLGEEAKELQKIPPPLHLWLEILDVELGQVIKSTESYRWLNQSQEQVFFNASGVVVKYTQENPRASLGNFASVHLSEVFYPSNFNDILYEQFGIRHQNESLYRLRVFGGDPSFDLSSQGYEKAADFVFFVSWLFGNEGFALDLTIYTDTEDKAPKYILSCLNGCRESEYDLIIVESTNSNQ